MGDNFRKWVSVKFSPQPFFVKLHFICQTSHLELILVKHGLQRKKSETKDICWKNFFWIFQKMKLVSYGSSGLLFELLSLCTQLQYIYLYCTAVKSAMNEMRKYMVKLISIEKCLKSWEFKDVKRDIPMCQSHSTRPHNAKQALYVIIHS